MSHSRHVRPRSVPQQGPEGAQNLRISVLFDVMFVFKIKCLFVLRWWPALKFL